MILQSSYLDKIVILRIIKKCVKLVVKFWFTHVLNRKILLLLYEINFKMWNEIFDSDNDEEILDRLERMRAPKTFRERSVWLKKQELKKL